MKIRYTPAAFSDLDDIGEYISCQFAAPGAAGKLLRKIEKAINALGDMPYSHELCRDSILREKGYRKLVVENHIVIYIPNVPADNITILRVYNGRQNYERYL